MNTELLPKLSSLTIFFPFYNDAGTVERQLQDALTVGSQLTSDLEVIALHGGASRDDTYERILQFQLHHPEIKIVDKSDNTEGYAVIKHGLYSASKDWVFYTDGDAQYDVSELPKLVEAHFRTGATVVNGYKTARNDNMLRKLFGGLYSLVSSVVFNLPIRDLDCDFRLIRTDLLHHFALTSSDSSVLGELIKKLQFHGAVFTEVPVHHYARAYGKSNYSVWHLAREKMLGDLKLYVQLYRQRGN